MLKRWSHPGTIITESSLGIALLFLFLFTLLTCDKETVGDQPGSPQGVTLREGDYLSTAYIDELKKTHSPLRAGPRAADSRLDLITVEKEGDLWRLMPVYNFHEAGPALVLHPDGSLNDSEYLSHVVFSVKDESSFRLGFDDAGRSFKATDYVFVQHVESYVANTVLSGTYQDRLGRTYWFQKDGWAIYPDRKFKFEIGIDHVLSDFDYFMEIGPNHIVSSATAFRWVHGNLQLFRTKDDGTGLEEISDKSPYLSLQPIR